MRSKPPMIVRIVDEILHTASAAPAVIQKTCCWPSARRTVSSTTWNAAGDIDPRTVGRPLARPLLAEAEAAEQAEPEEHEGDDREEHVEGDRAREHEEVVRPVAARDLAHGLPQRHGMQLLGDPSHALHAGELPGS